MCRHRTSDPKPRKFDKIKRNAEDGGDPKIALRNLFLSGDDPRTTILFKYLTTNETVTGLDLSTNCMNSYTAFTSAIVPCGDTRGRSGCLQEQPARPRAGRSSPPL